MNTRNPFLMADSSVNACDSSDPMRLMSHFYQQVVAIKQGLQSGDLEQAVSHQLQINRPPTGEELAEAVAQRLQRWVERCSRQLQKVLTDREFRLVQQALFVMVALADELLIFNVPWSGRDSWQQTPLEMRIFRSCYAGERFFAGVASLLKLRSWDPQQQNLAAVYLLAMRLGFEGCFRDQPKRLDFVRQQLYKRIRSQSELGRICPEAYNNVLAASEERRLAPLDRWYRLLALGAIAYLSVGLGIWLTFKGGWM